ncbi:HesB/YadR/YfhF family protein [Massilibacterium senegalense]|uniref:HesB/YadR/YfhF family protein n=1 Tax=Massilibacterium senegalense TaxID=1632858 RepID=UPI0007848A5A|nr:iron-sulfur cluster biosynthesis family protein [Massilibacterium senegalense]
MKFHITNAAVKMYKDEMELGQGDALRLFVRYAGATSSGFSLGVTRDEPREDDYKAEIEGITFLVNPDDEWFVNNMTLDYNQREDRVLFNTPGLMD